MQLVDAKCCPDNRYIVWIRKRVLPIKASRILRLSYLAGYVGDQWT